MFYESADDVMSKAPPVYPRHLARLKEFRNRGDPDLAHFWSFRS
jgi:hypothetical protein